MSYDEPCVGGGNPRHTKIKCTQNPNAFLSNDPAGYTSKLAHYDLSTVLAIVYTTGSTKNAVLRRRYCSSSSILSLLRHAI